MTRSFTGWQSAILDRSKPRRGKLARLGRAGELEGLIPLSPGARPKAVNASPDSDIIIGGPIDCRLSLIVLLYGGPQEWLNGSAGIAEVTSRPRTLWGTTDSTPSIALLSAYPTLMPKRGRREPPAAHPTGLRSFR